MKNKIFLIVTLTILATAVLYFVTGQENGSLVRPTFIQQIIHSQPNSTPPSVVTPNAPKTFNFDSSTDLKMELDKVNPQVLDSDFQ